MNALDRLFALEHHGIKLGLDNIGLLLDALGRPHDFWPALHIAGTNGKGSVSAMAERALRAAGHRTGRYTSPHLSRIEERVAIDGTPVDSATFARVTGEVLAVVDQLLTRHVLSVTPTFFEVTTAIAFELFRQARITAGVIEVGLGGRFDATNVLQPRVCAITSIALDHEQYLGHTLEQIAFEKAGIIKSGVPVVLGPLPARAHEAIVRVADEREAPVIATAATTPSSKVTAGEAKISLHTGRGSYEDVRVALPGTHQIANAVTAIHLLEAADAAGVAVSQEAIVTGIEQVEWPARLEWLVREDRAVLLDAAHNPAGAEALASYLAETAKSPRPIVFAVMRDKDVGGIVRALAGVTSTWVLTQTVAARAMPVAELAAIVAAAAPNATIECHPAIDAAMTSALRVSPMTVVAGSIFLVGPVREWLVTRGFVPRRGAP